MIERDRGRRGNRQSRRNEPKLSISKSAEEEGATERERHTFGRRLQKVRKLPLIMRHRRRQISFGIWRDCLCLPARAHFPSRNDDAIQNFCDKHRFGIEGGNEEKRVGLWTKAARSPDRP